jgi:hypothetical protein
MTADADIAALIAIEDPSERVQACGAALSTIDAQTQAARDRRDALIYAGVDRYGRQPVGCLVPGCDGAHKALGLCGNHYWRYRHTGDWQALGLSAPPTPTSRAWKKTALATSGLTNWIFQRVLGRRAYTSEDGYWRARDSGASIYRLPDPDTYGTPKEHWLAVRALNEEAQRLDELADRIINEVRNPALWDLMADEPSNLALAALSGLSEDQVYAVRRKGKEQHLIT